MTMSTLALDPKLLEILRAPGTRAVLRHDTDRNELVDDQAGLAYPIRNGIPIMLMDEARSLDAETDHSADTISTHHSPSK